MCPQNTNISIDTMTSRFNRRDFIVRSSATLALGSSLAACGSDDPSDAEFRYGVASGDPLVDRVILWTHARRPDVADAVNLTWQVATDAGFATIVASGRVSASADTDYTAKVDATGLRAGTSYFYRFVADTGGSSPVGRTRTLPAANVAAVKFAVFSCSLYSEGYFNAYDAAAKSDAEYALHLGDYIYEYGAGPAEFGNSAIPGGRVTKPANDIVSLSDYRTRYALYRTDAMLQAVHAKLPFITIWDDHEFANNAWIGGAENHDPATQGSWTTRKANAARAYHEWMPIRTQDPANLLKIYRSFDFGSLLSLHMLDTRIEGRDQQYDNFGDADGGYTRYGTGLATGSDANRHMISATQQAWLTGATQASTAIWQILGNQDIMARMWIPASVLQAAADPATAPAAVSAYLGAKATRFAGAPLSAAQAAQLDLRTNPLLPYNLDAWDGYPMQRDAILQAIQAQGKHLVVLSGDSHNAWFSRVRTLSGAQVGVEFAAASVTSPGFESVGLGGLASSLDGTVFPQGLETGLGLITDLNYADTVRRGYLQLTVTASTVKGEYVFVDTVKSTTYTASVGRTISVDTGQVATYA
jgi:alkaline phosphatase D